MSKFLNVSTDNTLGGSLASDEQVASQKAVKEYVDNHGGGGGGDTVTGKTVTLGTTGAAVIQVNGVDAGSVSLPSGSTSTAGIVQLTNSTSSTSTTTAATPNSVKSSYDLAADAIPKSTGSAAGDIIYYTGASTPTRLAKGTAGQVLTMNSGETAPEWKVIPGNLPTPTSSDENKLLSVNSSGNYVLITIVNSENVAY